VFNAELVAVRGQSALLGQSRQADATIPLAQTLPAQASVPPGGGPLDNQQATGRFGDGQDPLGQPLTQAQAVPGSADAARTAASTSEPGISLSEQRVLVTSVGMTPVLSTGTTSPAAGASPHDSEAVGPLLEAGATSLHRTFLVEPGLSLAGPLAGGGRPLGGQVLIDWTLDAAHEPPTLGDSPLGADALMHGGSDVLLGGDGDNLRIGSEGQGMLIGGFASDAPEQPAVWSAQAVGAHEAALRSLAGGWNAGLDGTGLTAAADASDAAHAGRLEDILFQASADLFEGNLSLGDFFGKGGDQAAPSGQE
jgi:hypothetical protein